MKYIVALLLTCCGFAANAQTIIALAAGNCNVAQTVCSVPNDVPDATITFVYNPSSGLVTLVVTLVGPDPDYATSTVEYTGYLQLDAPTTATNFLVVTPFSATLSPSALLSGNIRKTRSGSGRGGWTWHPHWDFQTLVIY